MKKHYLHWSEVENQTQEIIRQISRSRWHADYVVGMTCGGLVPATLLSQYFECPMYSLDIGESNTWMAEDALGHPDKEVTNILIVDDYNNTGDAFNWLVDDWKRCVPDVTVWDNIWNKNVRFACLYDNLTTKFDYKIDYCAKEVNNVDEDTEIQFPWQEWWNRPFGY